MSPIRKVHSKKQLNDLRFGTTTGVCIQRLISSQSRHLCQGTKFEECLARQDTLKRSAEIL